MRNLLPSLQIIVLSCVLVVTDSIRAANDLYVVDKSKSCKVFRPNVQAGETVSWTGKCLNEMADGQGTAQWSIAGKATLSFSGTFKNGRLQGKGTMSASGGDRYDGNYQDGMRDGKGVYVAASGERYEGTYKNNQRDGPGVLTDAQGRRTEGIFQSGVMVSQQSTPKNATPVPSGQSSLAQSVSPSTSASSSATVLPGSSVKIGQEAKTASGALFRVDECGGLFGGVLGAPPRSLDLSTSTPSKSYSSAEATGGVFPVIREAVEFFLNVCKPTPGHRVVPPGRIYLFANGLPPPGSIAEAMKGTYGEFVNVASGGGDSWSVQNGPSDTLKKSEKERREFLEETKRKREAMAQRDQEEAKRIAFLKQHGAIEIPKRGILRSNPFSLEGKVVAIPVNFYQMTTSTVGRFEVLTNSLDDRGGAIIVSDIPKGTFLEPTRAFLAAKVIGLTAAKEGGEPLLKFVGVAICQSKTTFGGAEPPCP